MFRVVAMRLLVCLFSPAVGTYGGLTRGLAVAETAREHGHHVVFAAAGGVADVLARRGEEVVELPAATHFGLPGVLSRRIDQRSQNLAVPGPDGTSLGNLWRVMMAAGLARRRYLAKLVAAEVDAVDQAKADVIFTDIDPAAFVAAAATGVPIASTYSSILHHGAGTMPWQAMERAIGYALRRQGCDERTPDELLFAPSVLKIVPSVPALDDADPTATDVRYVGQLIADLQPAADLDFPDPRRLVLGYLGAGSLPLSRLRTVLPAAFPADGPRACLVASQTLSGTEQVGGVTFTPYVPVEQLLPRTDFVLCHGGQNTIIQALRAGVPLLFVPGPVFERRYNAEKTVAAGAGLMSERGAFSAGWLNDAFERRAELAAGAAVLRDQILAAGGSSAAVTALTEHARSGSPDL
jgi:UDP:flavonoid glycosyltransferase YjiC (YdhE family)